jgi:ABC-type dipeptide/oligopeptide/nickel transport system permease component
MIGRFVAGRVGIGLVQLALILVLVFVVMRALPADPVGNLIGLNATADQREEVERDLGLDQSVLTQFRDYSGIFPREGRTGLLQGDLGTSWTDGSSIGAQIADFLPVTLELITYSLLVACLIAVPVGILAALRPNGVFDRLAFSYSLFAGAQPEFWWALVLIYFFFYSWGVSPAPIGGLDPTTVPPPDVTGALTIDSLLALDWNAFTDAAAHLVLPVAALSFVVCGPIIKMVRHNMLEALESDYVMYARASGLPQRRIVAYTARNAFAPSLTLIAILLGYLIGGAVLVEQVFSLGGIGQYAVRSVLAFDFPAIQSIVLVITALFLLIYLSLDTAHALLDPRVRAERGS